jgi:SAM-dependent methyltransferase
MAANQNQVEAWNGGESVHYVDHADRYDRQLAPFGDALFEHVRPEPQHSVLDIGCGCGATTLAAAHRARYALGADLSEPLLEIAASRARSASIDNVEFVVADAQTHTFDEGAFDLLVSQFGLMFFDDSESAFANLRRALAPGGRAAFICWQGLEANEWLMVVGREVARRASLPELGGLAGGPGMFSLQDPDETVALLDGVGFTQIACESVSPTILLGGGGTLDEAVDFLLGMGMVRGLLGRVEADARRAVIDDARAALIERYEPGVGVRLGTGAWLVSARN